MGLYSRNRGKRGERLWCAFCREQTTKSEKILFAFLGRRPVEDGEAEKAVHP